MRGATDRSSSGLGRRVAAWVSAASLLALFLILPIHGAVAYNVRPPAEARAVDESQPALDVQRPAHDRDHCLLCQAVSAARAALHAQGVAVLATTGFDLPAVLRAPTSIFSFVAPFDAPPRAPPAFLLSSL